MKKLIFPVVITTTLLLSAYTAITSMNWKIAEGYSIKFTSNDPSGAFTSLKGNIAFDEKNPGASIFDVTIDANSINTGNGMKNGKAKSEEWFNVEKYPTIKFTSNKISKSAAGYEAAGTLEIKGVKKQITIPFTFSNNTFTGSFEINRLDYGVGTDQGMSAHAAKVLKVDVSVPVTQ